MSGHPMLIRAMVPGDLPLVTNSWLTNNRKTYHTKGIPNDVYYSWQHRILEELLPRATTIIVCDPEDLDTIYGWACFEVIDDQLVFHYIYVKQPFKAQLVPGDDEQKTWRGWGVGKAMVLEALKYEPRIAGITLTAETMASRGFFRHLDEQGLLPHEPVYNPFLLYSSLQPGWGSL